MASRAHDQLLSRSAFDEPYQRIYSSWWSDRCGETKSMSSYTGTAMVSCSLSVRDWLYQLLGGNLLCSLGGAQLVNTQTYDQFWVFTTWYRSLTLCTSYSSLKEVGKGWKVPNACCLLFPRNTLFHPCVILSYVDGKASSPLTHKHSKCRITSVVGTRWIVSSILRLGSTFQWLFMRIC